MSIKDFPQLKKLSAYSIPFESSLVPNDYWALLFIGCVSLFIPMLGFAIPIYIFFKTSRRTVAKKVIKEVPRELEQIVILIQKNRLQSLITAIESNPTVLHCDYNKHSLLSWCKFYNNTKALMVILEMLKKYPPEKVAVAA